ncbi:hypothetical protein [Solilutibacter silvestris]|nr:hypothetical protein [Lysobacter silvestris]
MKTSASAIAICVSLIVAATAIAGQPAAKRKAKTVANDPNSTVIYRCTAADGMLSIQSVPCPHGQHQERSVIARPIDPVTPLPTSIATTSDPAASTAAAAPTQPAAAAPSPAVDDTPLPPPPLYRCHTPSGGSYVNDTDSPPERCREVPLVNISGSQNVPEHDGRMQCEMEHDRCERIADQELCATWQQRLREAKAMLELGNPDLVERATTQRDQSQRVVDRACLTQH